jgi:hypothetical protein
MAVLRHFLGKEGDTDFPTLILRKVKTLTPDTPETLAGHIFDWVALYHTPRLSSKFYNGDMAFEIKRANNNNLNQATH